MTPAELLSAYDEQVRGTFASRVPAAWSATQDGPLTRCLTTRSGFAMSGTDLSGLTPAERVALVERTTAYYASVGRGFEWKTFDHDHDGLRELLVERGFAPDDHEALVLGDAAIVAADPVLPSGLRLRAVTSRADLERVQDLEIAVWDARMEGIADDLEGRVGAGTTVLVVEDTEAGDLVVSAAWLEPFRGTTCAGLWGGSTLAAYRGRGLYRALVARRAQLALAGGFTLLQVDASDDSRPILERLGLQTVGGTVPYLWTLPSPPG